MAEKKYTYTYDEWHRLETSTREDRQDYGSWSTNYEFDFQYDRYNNLTKRQKVAGSGPTWTFAVDNTTNRVTSRTGGTPRYYYYNAVGQVTSDTLRNFDYTYDGANRLISVDKTTTNKGAYRYDAFGRRVTRDPGDVIYVYGARGELLLEDREGSTTPKSIYYVQAEEQLIATRTIGTTEDKIRFLFRNHLGDVRVTETVDLNYQWAQGQYCSGNLSYHACDTWNFQNYDIPFAASEDGQFQGHEYDETTFLNYMGARFYNPDLMRWMSPDPMMQLSPETLNRYTYVVNDPVGYVDPDGREHTIPPWLWGTTYFGRFYGLSVHQDPDETWIEDFYLEDCADLGRSVSNLGVSREQWFGLSLNQQASLLNIIAGLKWAGLPLDGVSVAWERQVPGKPAGETESLGVTDERVYFEFTDDSAYQAWLDRINTPQPPGRLTFKGQWGIFTVIGGHESERVNDFETLFLEN